MALSNLCFTHIRIGVNHMNLNDYNIQNLICHDFYKKSRQIKNWIHSHPALPCQATKMSRHLAF